MSRPDQKKSNPRKRILVIGMLDSVHFARWLRQFQDQDIDFYIYPSRKYKKLNPILNSLSTKEFRAKFNLIFFPKLCFISGYADFLIFEFLSRLLKRNIRGWYLKNFIKSFKLDFIHALEMQGAGYLLLSVGREDFLGCKVIVTNWGSDIYFYKNDPAHQILISRTLELADFYSAECVRDYHLARDFGFTGIDLPCIPNAGGFDFGREEEIYPAPSLRKQVLVKGYGNTFGKAHLVVELLPYLLRKYPHFDFHIYSVTDDINDLLRELPTEISSRLKVTTVRNRLTHSQMISEFRKSRVYIGCSASDGISTSFLESLITGCYPIQTNTSCANEWVDRGALASIIPLDSQILKSEIERALLDDQLVNQAAIANLQVAQNYLSFSVIQQQSLKFYE
jgi:glycosyltransferase involved in cell wall biosynthesis